jgi:aminopeptidase N
LKRYFQQEAGSNIQTLALARRKLTKIKTPLSQNVFSGVYTFTIVIFKSIRMKFTTLFLGIAAILFTACHSSKPTVSTQPYEIRILDTMVVTAAAKKAPISGLPPQALPEYRATATRTFDLLHTRLELSFDWEREAVLGKANLSLTPYFYPTDELVLDAKEFEIHALQISKSGIQPTYDYDGQQIRISLGKTYSRTDTLEIEIQYTALPSSSGGSLAIASNKGLFFINPRGETPNKPRQIWTQGETENNSRWFPTIDKPNERCTGELLLTVENEYKTLSNGVLLSSKNNPDGSRTDHWKMDLAHAPYLFMIAVGEFAVVKDQWREIPLEYYVEEEYEPHAKSIFPHTPEMLEFFSNMLDYPYPWPKYSQIVVRDFVSGAMENTTAVIFGDFVNGTGRELVDVLDNDKIVAHEMFHHWFGNLVTCESWSNLTLNEGFANYSEYLWLDYKYGRDQADYHLESEESEYVYAAKSYGAHPLIHFAYADREDMFDQHSYNKGGLVLHMLRNYLGDEAFFAGLNRYLSLHAFTEVEAHELRLAMEETSGKDLNWFFNQWFFQEGHPVLDIQYGYDAKAGEVSVTIEQTQHEEGFPPIFEFPVAVRMFLPDGTIRNEQAWMRERQKEFRFSVSEKPLLVLFDPERVLLGERTENKSAAEFAQQYYLASNVRDRLEALQNLVDTDQYETEKILTDALGDPFWAVRFFALSNMEIGEPQLPQVSKLASEDGHSTVRSAACYILGQSGDLSYVPALGKIAEEDYSLQVAATALDGLLALSPQDALRIGESMEPAAEGFLLDVIAEVYLQSGGTDKLGFFQQLISQNEEYAAAFYLSGHVHLARQGTISELMAAVDFYHQTATQPNISAVKCYAAVRSLNEIHVELVNRAKTSKNNAEKEELQGMDKVVVEKIEAVKDANVHAELKSILKNFPDPK